MKSIRMASTPALKVGQSQQRQRRCHHKGHCLFSLTVSGVIFLIVNLSNHHPVNAFHHQSSGSRSQFNLINQQQVERKTRISLTNNMNIISLTRRQRQQPQTLEKRSNSIGYFYRNVIETSSYNNTFCCWIITRRRNSS